MNMKAILSSLLIGASTVSLYASGNGQEDMNQNLNRKTVITSEPQTELPSDIVMVIRSFLPHKDVIAIGKLGKSGRQLEKMILESRAAKVNFHPSMLGIKTDLDNQYEKECERATQTKIQFDTDSDVDWSQMKARRRYLRGAPEILKNAFLFAEGMDQHLNHPLALSRHALAFKKIVITNDLLIFKNEGKQTFCRIQLSYPNNLTHTGGPGPNSIELDVFEQGQFFVFSKNLSQNVAEINVIMDRKENNNESKEWVYGSIKFTSNLLRITYDPYLKQFLIRKEFFPKTSLTLECETPFLTKKIYTITHKKEEAEKGLLDIQIKDIAEEF